MMPEISLLKLVEEIYTMSDIWVFHGSDEAFISRDASFPMTKTGSKRVIAETRIPNCQGIELLLFPILSCTRVEYQGIVLLLLFPILSCARVEYEAHYVHY